MSTALAPPERSPEDEVSHGAAPEGAVPGRAESEGPVPEGAGPAGRTEEEEPPLAAISAEDLHRLLLRAHVLGNRVRRKFLKGLSALARSRLYFKLGFSSIAQYAETHFGFQPGYTYELLRVARALVELRRADEAFRDGVLSWSAVREITRVARAETEEDWIRYARAHSVSRLRAEVKDALRAQRKRPREGGYGLPGLHVRVSFELAPEEHDILEKALKKTAAEMGACLGAAENGDSVAVEPRDALLFLARRVLETDPEGVPAERLERQEPLYTILYQLCPGCRKAAHLPTADGLVEIAPEVVERVEGEACQVTISPEETEEVAGEACCHSADCDCAGAGPASGGAPIDRPNTPSLRRKVLLRDGKCCTNPLCRRRLGLQAHHIRFRSHGGRTVVWNETAVCEICHALAHAGLLSVRRLKSGQLLWSRKVDGLPGALDLAREMADASSLPEVRVDSPRGEPEAANHPRGESRAGGSPRGENPPRGESAGGGETDGESLEEKQRECDADVACALVKLGFAKAVARARVQRARGALGQRGVEATAEALLRESLLQTVG